MYLDKGDSHMSAQRKQTKFKTSWSSVTLRQGDAGNMIAEVNMEGTAEGFGPFIGTMTVTSAGAHSGSWQWASVCWLDAGGSMDLVGQGRFEADRPRHFKAKGIIPDLLGVTMNLDSTIDLACKTWEGTVTQPG